MNIQDRIAALAALPEGGPAGITLTLDVVGSGLLPKAAALFLEQSLKPMADRGARSSGIRSAVSRILDYVKSDLRPGAEGVYLAAGAWGLEAIELAVPLRNSVQVASAPVLAPLWEAFQRWPRSWFIRYEDRRTDLMEFDLGRLTLVESFSAVPLESVPERTPAGAAVVTPGRAYSGHGSRGDRRDRYQQMRSDAVESMFRLVARAVGSRRGSEDAPVFVQGAAGRRALLLRHLSKAARAAVVDLGGPNRNDTARARIMETLARAYEGRVESKVLDFVGRRSRGAGVELGPEDSWRALREGRASRLYFKADESLPGIRCGKCGESAPGSGPCARCGGAGDAASLTEAALKQAIRHRTPDVTFVPAPAGWLNDLGGMAALVSR